MIFSDIPAGVDLFLDANTLIYHFVAESIYGAACSQLIKRIELQQVKACLSTDVLADVAHRLMTIEAAKQNGWPLTALAARLRTHRDEIPKLTVYRQAVAEILKAGIHVFPVTQSILESAITLSHQHELLMGDATIVAVMYANRLAHLASRDRDFDCVPGITRYAPV